MTADMDAMILMQFGPFPLRVAMTITFLAHRVPSLSDFGRFKDSWKASAFP
jgi:hypothetical protein